MNSKLIILLAAGVAATPLHAGPLFGVAVAVGVNSVTGNTQDFHQFDSLGFLPQLSLTDSEHAHSTFIAVSNQIVSLTGDTTAMGTAMMGKLLGSIASSVVETPFGGFEVTSGGATTASWMDTFTATGQGSITYKVTFMPVSAVSSTLGGIDCGINLAVVSATAQMVGPVNFQQNVTDCPGFGQPFQTQQGQFSVPAGTQFTFMESITASITNLGYTGGVTNILPDGTGSAGVDFAHGVLFFLDPLTPGGSYVTASGGTYFTPLAGTPEPASWVLVLAGAALISIRSIRFRRKQP